MNRERADDPRSYRRLVQQDGLPYPMRLDEAGPQSYNIVEIAQNVRSNISSSLEEMDRDVGKLGEFVAMQEFHDNEFGYVPRRYKFLGDPPKPTRRPFKNFLRTVLHIRKFRSDEELQEEARAVQEILRRYPDRAIKIYNVNTLLAALAATPGVTATPDEIIRYLRVIKVANKYKTYRSSRKYFTKCLSDRKKLLENELGKCQAYIDKMIARNQDRLDDISSMDRRVAWHKVVVKGYGKAYRDGQHRFIKLMLRYWEFKLMNDDCFSYLFEFLSTFILNFCKLNPTRKPKH